MKKTIPIQRRGHPAPLLVNRPEAAASLNISIRLLDDLISSGELPAVKIRRRAVRIRSSDLESYCASKVGRPMA